MSKARAHDREIPFADSRESESAPAPDTSGHVILIIFKFQKGWVGGGENHISRTEKSN